MSMTYIEGVKCLFFRSMWFQKKYRYVLYCSPLEEGFHFLPENPLMMVPEEGQGWRFGGANALGKSAQQVVNQATDACQKGIDQACKTAQEGVEKTTEQASEAVSGLGKKIGLKK
ncbi:adipogenesis regulatory factor isoform X1 [Gopherus evgoodei]|uniref:adipogenesis regulatory factor isoform X1 n=1 Tax=Gopherus evgoodei TaxID=1825980 RepID=UPI0011CFFB70|nr:adipogenesis regulatory factor isoform X1 [Gopherus evgoodei]XP_030426907.1 adipogenesis regulatory factor isoform X1 [Gopherus evgoodei]XP_030426908.1 adipogenesis regulatory factor isoform X1 [Gopherus evgoodei]